MPEEIKIGCARPTGGPVADNMKTDTKEEPIETKKEENMIKVG